MKIKLTYEQIQKVMVEEAKSQVLDIQERLTETNPGGGISPYDILDYASAEDYLMDIQLQRAFINILRYYMVYDDAEAWLKENNIG